MTQTTAVDNRQRTLDEATRLFVQHGYHGISMRMIAENVGVSKAGLYYHFRDKEALLMAILVANIEQIEAIVQNARLSYKTPRQQIGAILREIIACGPEQRAIIRLASQVTGQLSIQARSQFTELYHRKFTGQVEAILVDGMRDGYLHEVDSRHATWILLGMMYPFFYPSHEREVGSVEEATELMLTIFFEGLATGS